MQRRLKSVAFMVLAKMNGKAVPIIAIAAILILAISAVPVSAQLHSFTAVINSGQEPPPNTNTSPAQGVAFVTFDSHTGELCFSISFEEEKLTAPETNAHFHAPGRPGVNAGVVVQLPTPGSPKNGCVTPSLSDELIHALFAGLWYINIHTQNNPGGEIRGQVNPTFLNY